MNIKSRTGKAFIISFFAAACLSACAGGAVIPAVGQTEQLKDSTKTLDSAEETLKQIEAEQQQRIDDLCSGATVAGFNC